uniref:Uncharacterized protein n=1 Tax=Hyaloperonospora arabidopsidis (strain Emoy2) TaxID=559515 RepID=M4BD79_HYAAE
MKVLLQSNTIAPLLIRYAKNQVHAVSTHSTDWKRHPIRRSESWSDLTADLVKNGGWKCLQH